MKYQMWHEYERMKGKEILVVCKQVYKKACGKLYLTLVSGDM